MVNKNIKRMLLFVALCIMLVGIVSAQSVDSNDTTLQTDTISDQTTDSLESVSEINDNAVNNNEKLIKDVNTQKSTKTATAKTKTKVSLQSVKSIPVDETVLITGTLTDTKGNPVKYALLSIKVNGEVYDTETDDRGDYLAEYVAYLPGTNSIRVSYAGSSKYEPTSANTTFTVTGKAGTYIKLNKIQDTTLGSTVKISGHYYYGNDIPLTYTPMKININGQTYTNKTDSTGYFTYNYKTTNIGKNTVNVSYPGNTRFQTASTTASFNVKTTTPQTTTIVLNNVADVAYGASTTISGYYYYGNKIPLTYTNMRLNINGQQVLAKTDDKGYFTYSYKANRVGKNTVTVSYPGNSNFKSATATKTFNVKITSPISTYIKLDNIKEVTVGQTATISGHYYYSNDIPLTYTPMKVNINGQQYTAKTDGNGYFTCNYKTTKNGTGTVTVSYPGNTNFKSATATKTFYVKSVGAQYTYIVLDNISDVSYDDAMTISGHYYYGNNIPLTYTPMRITINGMLYETVKTDDKGYFTYYHIPDRVFKNTLTVSYKGNSNFQAASVTKTFNVKITSPIPTYVELFEVEDVDVGDITTINGYYSYGYGEPLVQTTMTININGKKVYAKTDSEGYFYYDYETTKVGTNTVTVSYAGNSNFKAASSTATFNVGDKYKVVTMTITSGNMVSEVIDGDPFAFHYSTSPAQYDPGVYVEIDDRGLEWPPVNKLDHAVIYFRNSKGNIITKTVTPTSINHIETSLIDGYTPFKAEVTYCKMTDDERDDYWFSYYE